MTASNSSTVILTSIRSRRIPALLTRTSSPPYVSMAASMRRFAPSGSEMSSPLAIASPPMPRISSTTSPAGPAGEVVEEIRGMGGEAIANGEDISDPDGAKRLIDAAIETYGGLDVLVNNAGILRDRMLVNMTVDEFDAVIRVHLRGTFAPMHWAAGYWRDRAKAGQTNDARIINTTSPSGIYGNVGQTNYGAAKAGIASMTVIAAMELGRYGVTVNAIAPAALTRMTENLGMGQPTERKPDEFEPNDPDNIAPLVVWLGSPESKDITGRVFNVFGGHI